MRAVLHLRVIAPEDLRDDVIGVLQRRGRGREPFAVSRCRAGPAGDEITADIARECANDVIKQLKALDVQHRGAITLEVLDTVLSSRAHRAEDEAVGDPADALRLGRTDRAHPRGGHPQSSPSCCS